MSTLLYTAQPREMVPDQLEQVATTVSTVTDDAPSMMDGPPQVNEIETDPTTDGGLTTHQLASYSVPREYHAPAVRDANDWGDAVQREVNDRISTTGLAASREASGDWGHGTFGYLVGIEPAITPGTEFSNTYFDANDVVIQDGAGAYMTTLRQPDDTAAAEVLAQARRNAREQRRDQYKALHAARNAGVM